MADNTPRFMLSPDCEVELVGFVIRPDGSVVASVAEYSLVWQEKIGSYYVGTFDLASQRGQDFWIPAITLESPEWKVKHGHFGADPDMAERLCAWLVKVFAELTSPVQELDKK